jgi:PAS domain S-box-containing protein
MAELPDSPDDFRWTAFFQRSTEAVFVLNRRGQILFVNRGWETLTGLARADVRRRVCKRARDAAPGSVEALLGVLAPPREVSEGRPASVRRLVAQPDRGPRWWDVEFVPLTGPAGFLGALGKVREVAVTGPASQPPLPEKLMALRQRRVSWWGLEHLTSEVAGIRRLAEQVRLALGARVPVLLVGEPGAGKQWLARTIHHGGPGRESAFCALDSSHLPAASQAWLLFGLPGWAQRGGGTLYLQEPFHMPRELQARLVELFTPADDEGRRPRLLAGCSTDPAAEVRAGRLLEELHCLLSPLTVSVPPLRERLPELPQLVGRLLERATGVREQPVTGVADDAMQLLRDHAWPGNVRELYAVLAGACQRAKGERLEAGDLPYYLRGPAAVPERILPLDKILEQVERRLLQVALAQSKGNKSKAADLLAIWRPRLLRRLEALGLDDG